jgi:hypothetical protein
VEGREVIVVAKLAGHVLTQMVLKDGVLKLIRCLESAEVAADLYPTFAYVEDQLGAKASQLVLCGFGEAGETYQRLFEGELGIPVEQIRSPLGAPGENNAGLLGYLAAATVNN